MKKITILLACIPFVCFGQETTTIKVTGRAVHHDKTPIFKGDVTLGATFSNYTSEAISLDQMKEQYDQALKRNGLALSEFKEDPLGYAQLGYDKKGILYQYKTTSIDKFQGFLMSKSFGLQRLDYSYTIIIDTDETILLIAKALEDAKLKAQLIASEIGKKLGSVRNIEDRNILNTEIKKSMYYEQRIGEYSYEIIVIFDLKE